MKHLKTFEAYNPYDEYEQGEFDFTPNNQTVEEIFDIFKKNGVFVFKLDDDKLYQFTDYLNSVDFDYGETSQIGTDVTIYDRNNPNNKRFMR